LARQNRGLPRPRPVPACAAHGQKIGSRALSRGFRPGAGDQRLYAGGFAAMGGFIVPVIEVVIAILNIYWWLVIIQAVVSWLIAFNIINTYSRPVAMVLDFLYRITEPVLRPIRQFIPMISGLDISPLILLLVIWFASMELRQFEFFMLTH
jgi:YggT family protein